MAPDRVAFIASFAEGKTEPEWTQVPFMDLRKGQVFRLFEPEDVVVGKFVCEATAAADAFLNSEGVPTVQCFERFRDTGVMMLNYRHG